MKPSRIAIVAIVCIVAGMFAGYGLAFWLEQNRLERNKALVRMTHDRVWSEKNVDAAMRVARDIYLPNFTSHDWSGDSQGLAPLAQSLVDQRLDFPDYTEKVEIIIAEGDFVAARYLSRGAQGRDIPAIPGHLPATANRGKSEHMSETEFFRVANGKLAEQWNLADIWHAEIQLGLFDPDHWTDSVCGPAGR